MARAALRRSASLRMRIPQRASASGRFGVTRSQSGKSSRASVFTAAAESRRVPDLAIITGSSTTFFARWRRSPAATARTRFSSRSAPILTADGSRSEKTASIWARIMEGESPSMRRIPLVFCAVAATSTVAP